MKRRRMTAWGCALGACLVAGCFFPSSARREDDLGRPPKVEGRLGPPPLPPPDVKSNYQVQPPAPPAPPGVRPALEPVRLQEKPPPPASPPEAAPPPEPHLVAGLREAAEKHPREVLDLLRKHDKPNKELLRALMSLTAGVGADDLDRLSPQEAAAAVERLTRLTAALRERVELSLDQVCFCRQINNFGRYDPLPTNPAFHAGVAGAYGECVRVYAEVRNFRSARGPSGYQTVLASTLEIRDERGCPVVTMTPKRWSESSQTPRQDCFLNIQFHIPPKVPPGSYTLWVKVVDVTPVPGGGPVRARAAHRTLDFQVVAPGQRNAARAEAR